METAQASLPAWQALGVHRPASSLRAAAAIVRTRRFDLAALKLFEVGKPWREADADVAAAVRNPPRGGCASGTLAFSGPGRGGGAGACLGQNEILSPVLAILRARDFDHAIERAKNTDYALTAGG